jgi:hypothetical protein
MSIKVPCEKAVSRYKLIYSDFCSRLVSRNHEKATAREEFSIVNSFEKTQIDLIDHKFLVGEGDLFKAGINDFEFKQSGN